MKVSQFLKWIGIAMAILLGILMFAGYVLRVVEKVRSGHGLDIYRTADGVEFNYIGAFILLLLIPLALAVGWGIRYWQLRDERSFKKKFGIKE